MRLFSAPVKEELLLPDEMAPPPDPSYPPPTSALPAVLLIDDDPDIHFAIQLSVRNARHQSFVVSHAHSLSEARKLLTLHKAPAVIILGPSYADAADLMGHIRQELGLADTHIILCIEESNGRLASHRLLHGIDDIKTRSDFLGAKLRATIAAALRAHEQRSDLHSKDHGVAILLKATQALMACASLQSFSACVLAQVARLLRVEAEGVLCMIGPGSEQSEQARVIAAAGRYACCADQLLAAAPVRAYEAVSAARARRHHVYGQDYIALYFAGSADQQFAAFFHTGHRPGKTEQQLVEVLAHSIALGFDNLMLVAGLYRSAFYDPLTRLPNRIRFLESLDEILDNGHTSRETLALIDIDRFAETNDALGHPVGDALLKAVAMRLRAGISPNAIIGRIGSDTFGLAGDSRQINPAAILRFFKQPFEVDGRDIQLSATAGLVRLRDYPAGAGGDALKDANIALKRAKQQQRSGHFYFSRSMGTDIRERVRLTHELQTALDDQELFLVYQPQIDLLTRRPVGVEALLRWRNKDGRISSPDSFIPLAENSGLIVMIGAWALREACRQLAVLQRQGLTDFTMSINVSQVQFRHPGFLETLRSALSETGVRPDMVELEITESMAMEEPDALIRLLEQVKQTGASIAIDDFGTGFSSLNYLRRLQADRLKIDRVFISEMNGTAQGRSIAEMVIQLGQNVGLSVIAEGVEDEEQAEKLAALGCPLAQGYLFARPMTVEHLAAWLRRAPA